MAYNHFGGGTDDVTVNAATGVPVGSIHLTVWTAETGGTQITDLLAGLATISSGQVVSNAGPGAVTGRYSFQAPDTYDLVWLDDGTNPRWESAAREGFTDLVALATAVAALVIPNASTIPYDPSTSAGDNGENDLLPDGVPILSFLSATTLQDAIDDLHREAWMRDLAIYMLACRDALRLVYPLVGAAPLVIDGESIPGIAGLTAPGGALVGRRIIEASLAAGTPVAGQAPLYTGTGEAVWGAPTAVVARKWTREAGDQNLKAMVDNPNFFINTSTLLGSGVCYAMRVWLTAGQVISNYVVHCQTVLGTANANTFACALANADATGSLVTGSGSADASSLWTTTGARSIALGTPFTVPASGWYYVLIQVGTVSAGALPKAFTGAPHALANAGLVASGNVAPNAANAPIYGNPTNVFTGITPPATTGNIIDGGNTLSFWVGLS